MPKKKKDSKLNLKGVWSYGPEYPPIIKDITRPDGWSSGTHGPTWIQIAFAEPVTITKICAIVDQGNEDYRTDLVSITTDAHHFPIPVALSTGKRKQDDPINYKFDLPLERARSIRIDTSYIHLSWVGWGYIDIYGY